MTQLMNPHTVLLVWNQPANDNGLTRLPIVRIVTIAIEQHAALITVTTTPVK
tara:strand:+ start:65 stop:220 length:156 start_codon:yes stop_codon:yes gene_type:complete